MPAHWIVSADQADFYIGAGRAAQLVSVIGSDSRTGLADALLEIARDHLQAHHCTIFSYEDECAPSLLSGATIASARRNVFDVASRYTREHYQLDIACAIIRCHSDGARPSQLFVHREEIKDVDDAYREACYDRLEVVDRLGVLATADDNCWVSTNLYRDRDAGPFTNPEVETFMRMAPLLASCGTRHYLWLLDRGSRCRGTVGWDIDALCPRLTAREREVLSRILEGETTERIAEALNIRPTTVITYRTRAYGKLGVNSRRELFAAALRRRAPQDLPATW